jgi:hypothetical protein
LNRTLNESPDSTLADSLISQYGLEYLTPSQTQGMQLPSYSSYAAASAHIDSVQQALATVYNGSSSSSSGGLGESKPIPPPCDNGNYYTNLSGSGGFFSYFQATYSVSSGSVTNIDFTVLGTPLGWSWSQTNSHLSGSSGCTYGTLTTGLEIGNLTIGYI